MDSAQQNLSDAFARGDLETAALLLADRVSKSPADATAQYQLGLVLGRLKRVPEALHHLRRATQILPSAFEPHFEMGNLLSAADDADAAIAAFENAIALAADPTIILNNLGNLLRRTGDYEAALDVFKRARSIAPANLTVHLNYCIACETCGDMQSALEGYRAIIAQEPNHTKALVQLAWILAKSDGASAAEEVFRYLERALKQEPKNIRVLATYACAAINLGREDIKTRALDQLVRIPATTADEKDIMGWAFLQRGEPDKAFAPAGSSYNVIAFHELDQVRRSFAAYERQLPPWTETLPQKSDRPFILAVASGDYAELYASQLISSVLATSPGFDFHLHLVNPGAYDAEKMLASFPAGRVTWTAEVIDPPPPKSVYASRRFLRMPEFLRRTQRQIICVDIDCVFQNDLGPYLAGVSPYDILFYERPREYFLRQVLFAAFLAASPTPAGLEFMELVAAYLCHFEQAGTSLWFVDQMALVAAKTWFQTHMPSAAIKAAPQEILDWSVRPNALSPIWTAKGNRKRSLVRSS